MIPVLRQIARWEAAELRAGRTDATSIARAEWDAAWLLFEAHGVPPRVSPPRRWGLWAGYRNERDVA